MDPISQPVNPYGHTPKTPEQMQQEKAIAAIRQELDQKLLEVFNSPQGDALLDAWDDFFIRQAVVIPGAVAGTNEMREGRNAFIRTIRATVNRSRMSK